MCCYSTNLKLLKRALKSLYRFFLSFRLMYCEFMNSEFEKPKKISTSKYAFLSEKVRNLSFDRVTGTGTCDVAAVRRPSLSLVFYKEKRDKQST